MALCDKSAACESEILKKLMLRGIMAILGTLLVQICAAVWWAGSMNARMHNVERAVERCEHRVHTLELCASKILAGEAD